MRFCPLGFVVHPGQFAGLRPLSLSLSTFCFFLLSAWYVIYSEQIVSNYLIIRVNIMNYLIIRVNIEIP